MRSLLYPLCLCTLLFSNAISSKAQSFSVVHDTMYLTTTSAGPDVVKDSVYNTTPSGINIQWKVIATDFPMCWQERSAMCETIACYQMSTDLWPTTVHHATYGPGYDLITLNTLDLSACTPGCYYLTARLNNAAIPADTALITFIVCKPTPSKATQVTQSREIAIYPVPATSVLYLEPGSADIRSVVIYNIIGRQMGKYEANAGSMNIEHLPAGIYYARLLNEGGDVIATRKFTKQ